jgi:hypothetical protein
VTQDVEKEEIKKQRHGGRFEKEYAWSSKNWPTQWKKRTRRNPMGI